MLKPRFKLQEFDNKNLYIRRLCLAGIILLTAILQNTEGFLPSPFGFRAMPLIPAVVCIAMYEREIPGMFFGVFAGLLWDSVAASGANRHAVLLTIIGFVCGCLITHLMRNNILTAILLGGSAIVLYYLYFFLKDYIISGHFDGAYKLLTFYIPSTLYTALFLPLLYYIVMRLERRFSDR